METIIDAALAIDGGTPVRAAPFAPWPHSAEDDIASAASVLRSGKVNYWTGSAGRAFEREVAAFAGAASTPWPWRMVPWRWSPA